MTSSDFAQQASEAAMDRIDKLADELGLARIYREHPEVLAWHRTMLTAAWFDGADWGAEAGLAAAEAAAEGRR